MFRDTEQPPTTNKSVKQEISAFNSKVLRSVADEEIIYIHKGVDSTRSKISNNWADKFGKCKNCITNAKDKNVGNIIMPVQRYTNIFPVVLIKSHLQ